MGVTIRPFRVMPLLTEALMFDQPQLHVEVPAGYRDSDVVRFSTWPCYYSDQIQIFVCFVWLYSDCIEALLNGGFGVNIIVLCF